MSQHDTKGQTFDFGKIDWATYELYRPPYPNELYDIIFQHHNDHGGRWNTALDVGAGGGTVTKVLLQRFQQVVYSDAAAGYVAQASDRFSQEAVADRISFTQRKFDEFRPEIDFPQGLPDMITAGTCVHFGEPSKFTTQLAPVVRSKGTLAVFAYGGVPILPPDDPAGQCITKTKDTVMRWFHENVKPLDHDDSTGTAQARYDNIGFDPALWTNVRRITSLPDEFPWPEWIQPSESQVRVDERKEIVKDDFITRTVDYNFFPPYFENLAPGFDISNLIEGHLKKLKEALGDREVVARWPVMMVLATRK